ncbi:MAG: sensor histidine kinase [Verrucomicrobiaceae bacterium]|nr:MAG: sensor histidine kinase [Verrucomicrobiaceae bacterium]
MNPHPLKPFRPLELPQSHDFLAKLRLETRQLPDAQEIMRCCSRMLAEHVSADRCAYASIEDEAVFVISGDHCRGVDSIVGRWPVAAFGDECLRSMLADEPYVIDDVASDPRAGTNLEAYQATGIRSVICVPLHKAGKFTAAMAVHQTTARQWEKEEIELVRAVVAGCWESLERVHSDEQLHDTSSRLSLALLAAELGDWRWEVATDALTLSKRACEIFGIDEDEPITWDVLQGLLPQNDREATLRTLEEAVVNHEHYDAEYRANRRDASQVWISAKGRAHYDSNGAPVRMYGVVQDITKRKKMEEDLRANLAALAEADRKKDEFIALLAHELRNPLAPLRTGLEIARRMKDDPKVVMEMLEMADRQVSLVTRLINDLLDVSRITSGKLSLRMERVPVSEVIQDSLDLMLPHLPEQASEGLTITPFLPTEDLIVEGDRIRLTQILGNLLINSAKFTKPGGKVRIQAQSRDGMVEIIVEDNGVGISPEILPHIFEMFVQGEPGTSQSGLGLGLALTRSLVEMHGGSVTAESPGVGMGSRFTVSLPLCKATDTP